MKAFILLITLCVLTFTQNSCAGPAVIFQGSFGRFLPADGARFADGKLFYSGSIDVTSVATDGPIGSLYLRNDGNLYIKQDAGVSTNWSQVPLSALTDPMTTRGDMIFRDATNTTARLPIGANGQCVTSDGTDVSWGACGGANTLQESYDASTSPEITLDGTRGALTIRDNSTPIGAALLEVQNNGGGSTFFDVDVDGAFATRLDADNVRLDGNTISSTDVNGNIILDANGTGTINAQDQVLHALEEIMTHITTPANPSAGTIKLYAKNDDEVYKLNSAGAEVQLSTYQDPMTTRGDILVRDATNTTARLAVGGAATCLTSDGTDVAWGSCDQGAVELQDAYDNSTDGTITLDGTRDGVRIEDNSTPIGAPLFDVVSNGGGSTFFDVDVDGIGATRADIDNIRLDGNTISSQDVNGNILLDANGTGVTNVADILDLDLGITAAHIATPANPAASHLKLYPKSDDNWYKLDSAGNEVQLSTYADPMTTRGDIVIRDSTNTTARLAVGTVGQCVTTDGTDVSWGSCGSGATIDLVLGEDIDQGEAVAVGSDGLAYLAVTQAAGANTEEDFDTVLARHTDMAVLDSTRMIVGYRHGSGNARMQNTHVGVSGLSLTAQTPNEISTDNNADDSSIVTIDTDKTVSCWYDTDGTNGVRCVVTTWSGTSLNSTGTEVTMIADASVFQANAFATTTYAFRLDTNKFGVCARENESGGEGTVCAVGTVSGTTITNGSEATFAFNGTAGVQTACQVATDKFVVVKNQSSATTSSVVATVSGTTISYGSSQSMSGTRVGTARCKNVDTDKFITVIQDAGAYVGIVTTVATTTQTFGTEFSIGATSGDAGVGLSSTTAGAFVYAVGGALKYREFSITGTTLAYTGSQLDVTSNSNQEPDVEFFDSGATPVVCWSDVTDSAGTCVAMSNIAIDPGDAIGAITTTGTGGQTRTVQLLGGTLSVYSGQTPGNQAYIQTDGTITDNSTASTIGRFISATTLLLTKSP